jgi:hypothetical protein
MKRTVITTATAPAASAFPGAARPALLAPLAIALGLAGCASGPDYRVSSARCAENLCLAYVVVQRDTDGDGISDADEIAAGTDPRDPKSHPPALAIAQLIGRGQLDSFNRGFSEVVILPTKGPDGKNLVPDAVRKLKPDTLAAMGISVSTLAGFGIKIDDGFNLSNAFPLPGQTTGTGATPTTSFKPPMKIGGINIALYSDDENGVDMGKGDCMGCKNPDAQTPKTDNASLGERVVKFLFGTSDKPDAGTPDKPDAGSLSDPDSVAVVPVTAEEFKRVWFKAKGGTVSRTAGIDIPSPVDPNSPIIGRDPHGPIILVDPDQSDATFASRNKLIVIQPPSPQDKRDQNTNFGPPLLGGIQPNSAVPKP